MRGIYLPAAPPLVMSIDPENKTPFLCVLLSYKVKIKSKELATVIRFSKPSRLCNGNTKTNLNWQSIMIFVSDFRPSTK